MTASMSSTVESQSSELPRKPTPKTSEHRRVSFGLISNHLNLTQSFFRNENFITYSSKQ